MKIVLASAIATAVALASLAGTAAAQSQHDDRQALIDLDMVTISKDICGFELTDDQTEAIAARIDSLVEALGLNEDDAQKLYDQVETQMQRQKPAGLCNPKGQWAAEFKRIVAALPKG